MRAAGSLLIIHSLIGFGFLASLWAWSWLFCAHHWTFTLAAPFVPILIVSVVLLVLGLLCVFGIIRRPPSKSERGELST